MKKSVLIFFTCIYTPCAIGGLRDMTFIRRYNAAQGNILQAPLYFKNEERRRNNTRKSRFGHKKKCASHIEQKTCESNIEKPLNTAQNTPSSNISTDILNIKI